VTDAFVCRLLALACLAPNFVEMILDAREPKGLRLAGLVGGGPLVWSDQRGAFGLQELTQACSEQFGLGEPHS
jgi:hypothetical protein